MIAALGHFCIVGRGSSPIIIITVFLSVWPFYFTNAELVSLPLPTQNSSCTFITNMCHYMCQLLCGTTWETAHSLLHSSFFISCPIVFKYFISHGLLSKLLLDTVAGIYFWTIWICLHFCIKWSWFWSCSYLSVVDKYTHTILWNTMWTFTMQDRESM